MSFLFYILGKCVTLVLQLSVTGVILLLLCCLLKAAVLDPSADRSLKLFSGPEK